MSDVWLSRELLAEYIGEEGAAAFCMAFKGVSTYIPHEPTDRTINAVGLECAAVLSRQFGGCSITTPVRRTLVRPQVEALLESGVSPRDCALRVGCTERYARILARQMKGLRAAASA